MKGPGKDHVWGHAQLIALRLELVQKGPISGNCQRCSGKLLLKPRESSERHSETFLFDQSTRLHEPPSVSRRPWSMVERVEFERNSSPMHLHFIRRTASFFKGFSQRFGSRQHQRSTLKKLTQSKISN